MTGYRFLDGVTEATRDELRGAAVVRRFEPGEALFHMGDPARHVFAIDAGRLRLWRMSAGGTSVVVSYAYGGDLVGTVAVVQHKPYLANATAITRVLATAWSATRWRTLIARDHALAANVASVLAVRAGRLAERMEELVATSVEERVARALVRLATELGGPAAEPGAQLRIGQSEIAELAQTTVPTVSRLLGRWRAAGVVASSRGRLTVLDRDVLLAIAGAKG